MFELDLWLVLPDKALSNAERDKRSLISKRCASSKDIVSFGAPSIVVSHHSSVLDQGFYYSTVESIMPYRTCEKTVVDEK